MSEKIDQITNALSYENLSSLEISKRTGMSQPTVSRLLKKLPVIKLGAGRATTFALTHGNPVPLFVIDPQGKFALLAELYRQPGNRTLLVNDGSHRGFEDLPFFLYDVLPSGFLGAIALKNIVEQDPILSSRSDSWSADQILHYLLRYGYDLPGNLVVGDRMADKAASVSYKSVERSEYSAIANDINRAPLGLGSSVGGEQPKFTVFNGERHLIVKYSPLISEENPVATRHRDLLICEYLALTTLQKNGVKAANSTLYRGDRLYLEIERFDRSGELGRQGMASLRVLDAEYVGKNGTWPEISKALMSEGIITKASHNEVEVAYAFGRYIANTDMHLGNFSFFLEGTQLKETAPIYDMLPMAFMPKQGELVQMDFEIPRFVNVSHDSAEKAQSIALEFWQSVLGHPNISDDFKRQIEGVYRQFKKPQKETRVSSFFHDRRRRD
jgi:hypothetical protein